MENTKQTWEQPELKRLATEQTMNTSGGPADGGVGGS